MKKHTFQQKRTEKMHFLSKNCGKKTNFIKASQKTLIFRKKKKLWVRKQILWKDCKKACIFVKGAWIKREFC